MAIQEGVPLEFIERLYLHLGREVFSKDVRHLLHPHLHHLLHLRLHLHQASSRMGNLLRTGATANPNPYPYPYPYP